MNDILLATIPAALVLIATLGARVVEHYLQGKRETEKQKLEREREVRDARRKDRESIVTPIREGLMEIQTKLQMRSLWEFLSKGVKQGSFSLDQASMEKFKEVIVQTEKADTIEALTKRLPLVYQISNQETVKILQSLIFKFAGMTQEEKDKLTLEYWHKEFGLAYKKLEEYVALAD